MAQESSLISSDIEAYLRAHEQKSLLRFMTCGSVDDGKSTLIGRLLYESHMLFEDQLAALEADSKKIGTQGGDLDFALLVDGLGAEREQGITIDVAYRFFATNNRKFIVADTPGHEQYTRNMVTGASTADVAVILVDGRKGVLTQTRRHSYLVSLLGIRKLIVAINKLDLVEYSQRVFDNIAREYRAFAAAIGTLDVTCIPLSALRGDNIVDRSPHTPWYTGPTLMEYLDNVEVDDDRRAGPLRLPVQWVNRPSADFRGFSGEIVSGVVAVGDGVRVVPTGTISTVKRIVTLDGDLDVAVAGQSVTVVLADEVDCSRGDVLCAADTAADAADAFEAHVVWMSEQEMLPGRPYLIKLGTRTTGGTLEARFRVNVDTMERVAAATLGLNEIGVCNVHVDSPIPFAPYAENRDMGGFIVIDRLTNGTVGAGMLHFALPRAANVHWQELEVNKAAHIALKGHQPVVVWFTGLSGAGKSTVANLVAKRLHAMRVHACLLDGDNVRQGLNKDLGFTEADRVENIRRVAEVAKLMVDVGLVVLVSFISPFRAERDLARSIVEPGEFVEVHVDIPLGIAESRDVKGLYAKARRGDLPNFTGIDSPYQPPEHPELRLDMTSLTPQQGADQVVQHLRQAGRLG